jgi:ADP-ribose pyrophosphatase YjhB (NUDIX family)
MTETDRNTRFQGAIIRGNQILLIRQIEHASGHDYWLIPGGGRIEGEDQEACVIREMKEETHLEVRVERLLFEESWQSESGYRQARTFLCTPFSGQARPGQEPEHEGAGAYSIVEVGWFDLCDEKSWGEKVRNDRITYHIMKRIQEALGLG